MGVRTRERRNFDYQSGLSIPYSSHLISIFPNEYVPQSLNSEALARPWRGSGRDNPRANLSANNSPKGKENPTFSRSPIRPPVPPRPGLLLSPAHYRTAFSEPKIAIERRGGSIRFKSIRSRDRGTRTEYTVWMYSDVCVCVGVCRWAEYRRQREEERNSNVQYWTVPLISLSAGSRAQLIYS